MRNHELKGMIVNIESIATRAFRLDNEPLYRERYDQLVALNDSGKEPMEYRMFLQGLVQKGVPGRVSPHRTPSEFYSVTQGVFERGMATTNLADSAVETLSNGHTANFDRGATSPERIAASRNGTQERG